jgi:hypothetical protein
MSNSDEGFQNKNERLTSCMIFMPSKSWSRRMYKDLSFHYDQPITNDKII